MFPSVFDLPFLNFIGSLTRRQG